MQYTSDKQEVNVISNFTEIVYQMSPGANRGKAIMKISNAVIIFFWERLITPNTLAQNNRGKIRQDYKFGVS